VNSVLSPGVRVDVGAVVRDSIVMFDCIIRSGAVVDRAILDKEVVVGQGAIVGDGPDFDTPNRQEPGRLNTGITVVGKRAVIPRGARIGRNVKVAAGVRLTDFTKKVIPNGASVEIGAASRREAREARNTAPPAAAIPAAESTNGHREAVQVRAGAGRSVANSRTSER
jgi:carbonic anhydrase/acetyltransferase-like protein (isoleucine patch superfamily)